ncbi:MAG: outer membrane protein assembly factor BamB [Proteobacteria bacterium]|nr:outer membrane protein assembly factor BamB [Pseudomonadota bacterium]
MSSSNTQEPAELVDFEKRIKISEVWDRDFGSVDTDIALRLQPAIAENAVFAIDTDGDVTAYRKDNGKILWQSDVDMTITAGLGANDDYLFAGTAEGELIALSRKDGKLVWKKALSSEILAVPTAADNHVVVQTVDGKLMSYNTKTGARRWAYQRREPALSLRGTSTPVIFQGVVVTGYGGGMLVALRLNDGRLLWERPVSYSRGRNEVQRLADVDAAPLVAGFRLFAVSFQGKLVALDMRSGRKSWSKAVSSYASMAADQHNVYITDEHGVVRAYDQASGSVVWMQDKLKGRRITAPAVASSYVLVGDLDGYTHWLNTKDGSLVARHRIAWSAIVAQPVVDNDTAFVSTTSGDLVALHWN